jgi:plasmid stabilization system protein ParE
MKIRILRSALEDLASAREFYDGMEDGVGDYFFDSLFSDIDSLTLYAGIHRIHHGFHRMIANRFPYCIYYRVIQQEAVVFRVLDCRRDPEAVRAELKRS